MTLCISPLDLQAPLHLRQEAAGEVLFEGLMDYVDLPEASPRLAALAVRHMIAQEAQVVARLNSLMQGLRRDESPECHEIADNLTKRLKLMAVAYKFLMEPYA